jgi:hypothetical protein
VVDRTLHIGVGARTPVQWLHTHPRHAPRFTGMRGAARLRSVAK